MRALVLVAALITGNAQAFTCDKIVGHEDLTAFALDKANVQLAGKALQTPFQYPPAALGVRARHATNPVVRGNFATDHAENVDEVSLTEFYGMARGELLGYSSEHMDLHGLRTYRTAGGAEQVDSAAVSCRRAHDRIKAAARKALELWEDDLQQALFFTGHAIHPIQDSFSQAHTRRGPNLRQLVDVCTWEVEAPGACKHRNWLGQDFDPSDIIWGAWVTCAFSRSAECLKPEAAAAVDVTTGFLILMAQLADVKADATTIDARVESFLTTQDALPGSGFYDCSTL